MTQLPLKDPFNDAHFVRRENECISRIHACAAEMLRGEQPEERTFTFTGESGIGKTWLLRSLQFDFSNRQLYQQVIVFFVDLADYADQDPEEAVEQILWRFNQETSPSPGQQIETSVKLSFLSRSVLRYVRQLRDYIIVIIVDTVYEARWQLLNNFENYFLGPLAVENNTIIIMAGRGQPHPWQTPELGIKAAPPCRLAPFAVPETQDQLKRRTGEQFAREDAERIQEISHGNPFLNKLLAYKGALDDTAIAQALDAAITDTLSIVPESNRGQVRQYVMALCVLESFKEQQIAPLLEAYRQAVEGAPQPTSTGPINTLEAKRVKDWLLRYALAYYQDERHAYVLDPAIRAYAEQLLKRQHLTVWQVLHCTAFQLYETWAKNFKRAKERWENAMAYHRRALSSEPGGEITADLDCGALLAKHRQPTERSQQAVAATSRP